LYYCASIFYITQYITVEILGIDIGGSGMKAAPVNTATGQLIAPRYRIPTPKPATPEAMAVVIQQLVQHFNWTGPIGCGFPAALHSGTVLTATNIDDSWLQTNAVSLFESVTQLPCSVINDADAAALAECTFGAGKEQKGLIMVITVGTGIGSALLYNGQLIPNTELGHVKMYGVIAEKYASDFMRRRLGLDWQEWGTRFNEYLQYMEKLFYPSLFVIGGGISKKMGRFEEFLTCKTPVVPAQLRNHAGIIGAALAATQQQ